MSESNRGFSLSARANSFVHAFRGLVRLVQTQHNAWIHLGVTSTVFAVAVLLGISSLEWCWLLASVGSVWVSEAMNTSLEFLADAACPEYHPLIRDSKDIAAAAVLLISIVATINLGVLFLPHVARWMGYSS